MKKLALLLSIILTISIFASMPIHAASKDVTVTVNSSKVIFPDEKPRIVNGRTLVPLRAVFEKIGCNVEWLQSQNTALITQKGNTLRIKIGSDKIVLNNKTLSQKLDVKAQLIGGRTFIPLRFPLESLGYSVNWNATTNTANVSGKGLDYSKAYKSAELIYKTIGETSSKVENYFTNDLNNVYTLKKSLNEISVATNKAEKIYSIGFLAVDCINIADGMIEALSGEALDMMDSIIDAEETMYGYTKTEKMSTKQFFTSAAEASFDSYIDRSTKLLNLHLKRLKKGYFTYEEACAYVTGYYMQKIDTQTISTAVQLHQQDASLPSILSNITMHFLPGSLSDTISEFKDSSNPVLKDYYNNVNSFKSNILKCY